MGKEKTYIASFSGGKDSAATIILAHERGEPLDIIIFAEVMFDEKISGELPEHITFIHEVCKPLFESWGYEFKILHADKTYMDCFNHVFQRSKTEERNGKRYGFPMAGKCVINSQCKVSAIKKYMKQFDPEKIVQYLGIAVDEPERLERLKGTNRISLMKKYGYTESMAFELAAQYGLLSPIYGFEKRGGCWFCPNLTHDELKHLRDNHPELWGRLLALEDEPDIIGNIWNTLSGQSMKRNEEMLFWEDQQMTIFDFI